MVEYYTNKNKKMSDLIVNKSTFNKLYYIKRTIISLIAFIYLIKIAFLNKQLRSIRM